MAPRNNNIWSCYLCSPVIVSVSGILWYDADGLSAEQRWVKEPDPSEVSFGGDILPGNIAATCLEKKEKPTEDRATDGGRGTCRTFRAEGSRHLLSLEPLPSPPLPSLPFPSLPFPSLPVLRVESEAVVDDKMKEASSK